MSKFVICDSGPLINLSMNGLLDLIQKLKKASNVRFLITRPVQEEVYDRPSHIQQFELGALRINELILDKTLELPESIQISPKELDNKTKELLSCINKAFRAEKESIRLVSEAEVSCLALARELQIRGHQIMFAVDERTARLVCEKPENIRQLMEQKLHCPVTLDKRCLESLNKIQCIRTPELVYVAHKLKLTDLHQPQALEALLFATKFKGSAISWEEINKLKKL